MSPLHTFTWPVSRLGEMIEAMARNRRLTLRVVETPVPPDGLVGDGGAALGAWIEAPADWLGLEAEPVEARYAEVEGLVRRAGPTILWLPGVGEPRFIALLGGRRRTVSVLGPDLAVHRLRPEAVRAALCREIEAPLVADVDRLLEDVGVPPRRRDQARRALLRECLGAVRLGGSWRVRLPPGAGVWRQVRHARLPRRLLVLVGAHAVQYAVWLLAWWVIGQGVLQGRLERGWLIAWALLLLTMVPFRMLVTWSQSLLALSAGGLLKRRLLAGALRLEPEEIRQQGAGQLLGRDIESEAVEALALSGGLLGLVAGIELLCAAAVLGVGAGGGLYALLLLGWVALTGLLGWRYWRHDRHWAAARLGLTHDLVERMVGHRTRLAQEAPERWHDGEDQALAGYLEGSRGMDRTAASLMALVPRGWLLLGLIGCAPALLSGLTSPAALAVSLGGTLLAYEVFKKLTTGLWHLAGAAIAWQQVAPLFRAAARAQIATAPSLAWVRGGAMTVSGDKQLALDAQDLSYRYRDRGDAVLRGCSLRVYTGDRLLLEGPSGGGKSTLAALLTGLRAPASGLLLLERLDRQTLGSQGWRRRVVAAPQFHDNHVFSGTFAFNLLMGRRWPPSPEDVEAAAVLCDELGLGDLLARMPAGLLQMVGETGWQLSHGERSRLYIARALLQGADVIVLDESFAALDPETLRRALRCVLSRSATLLVIAHP